MHRRLCPVHPTWAIVAATANDIEQGMIEHGESTAEGSQAKRPRGKGGGGTEAHPSPRAWWQYLLTQGENKAKRQRTLFSCADSTTCEGDAMDEEDDQCRAPLMFSVSGLIYRLVSNRRTVPRSRGYRAVPP